MHPPFVHWKEDTSLFCAKQEASEVIGTQPREQQISRERSVCWVESGSLCCRNWGDAVCPVGYSDKPVPDSCIQETDRNLVEKRCWDVALGPLKQIPMNLFIMYMSGNTISIFPIMMVCMMAWRPIQALMSMSATFKLLESSSQHWLQGLVHLFGNLLGSALATSNVNQWDFCQLIPLTGRHS